MSGWSLVYVAPTLDADVVAAALEAAGLTVQVIMESTSALGFGPGGADSQVYVSSDQVAQARRIIERAEGEHRQPEEDRG